MRSAPFRVGRVRHPADKERDRKDQSKEGRDHQHDHIEVFRQDSALRGKHRGDDDHQGTRLERTKRQQLLDIDRQAVSLSRVSALYSPFGGSDRAESLRYRINSYDPELPKGDIIASLLRQIQSSSFVATTCIFAPILPW